MHLATHPRPAVSLTVAAEYLQLHEQTVRARIEDGRLLAIRDGRAYRITLEALATYEARRDEGESSWRKEQAARAKAMEGR